MSTLPLKVCIASAALVLMLAQVGAAQTSRQLRPEDLSRQIIGPMIWLVAGGVLIGIVGFYIQRWFKRQGEPNKDAGFTLSSLRELHRRGELTSDEYERAKAQIIGQARGQIEPTHDDAQQDVKQADALQQPTDHDQAIDDIEVVGEEEEIPELEFDEDASEGPNDDTEDGDAPARE